MLKNAITGVTVPVRAVITGSPVLAGRLWAPASASLAKAAAERKAIADALATARAEQLAKLTDEKAITAAKKAHAEADKATRAEKRERLGGALGGGALVAVVAGPVSWSLVGPWVPMATWTGIGLWCVAAMAHAPKISTGEQEEESDLDDDLDDDAADTAADVADDQEQQPEPVPVTVLTEAQLATTVERMVATRAQSDGGAGKVHLSEVLATLQRHGLYPSVDTREFGAAIRAAGLPVEKAVRIGKQVSPGLTVAGLTTHLRRSPQLPAQAVTDHTPAQAV